MQGTIRTVLDNGYGEYEEKRSRFLAWVFPVSSEEEVFSHLQVLKKKYYDARHHCYAYIIEGESEIQRFSDDGEPSGTAGLPILETIRKKGLTNVLVVVVRYFGGILLGASGLVRAYGKAATASLDNAKTVIRKLCHKTSVSMDYTLYGKLLNYLESSNIPICSSEFTSNVEVVLLIEEEKKDRFHKEVTEITGGKAEVVFHRKEYAYFDEEGNFLKQ
ncbi:MAG: YigZ family protein [Clostridiaceae bacterium]|nr:YigZ family protein [Clostridiaceae bacterium]